MYASTDYAEKVESGIQKTEAELAKYKNMKCGESYNLNTIKLSDKYQKFIDERPNINALLAEIEKTTKRMRENVEHQQKHQKFIAQVCTLSKNHINHNCNPSN